MSILLSPVVSAEPAKEPNAMLLPPLSVVMERVETHCRVVVARMVVGERTRTMAVLSLPPRLLKTQAAQATGFLNVYGVKSSFS